MQPTEEIKQRLDLVDFIQGYIKLTPAGANWKARCPFHNEKTPSFMVSREKSIWHCFGCGRGGDIFSFLQELEGVDFSEALEVLATRAGVQLIHQDPRERTARQRLLDVLILAVKVYHRVLVDHEQAGRARSYLAKRGVSDDMITHFSLGYAPESWEGVNQFLKKKGFSDDEIFRAGLTVKRDRGIGYYDRFRNRLIFPVADHLGRIVGFGGRALEDQQEPKYLNSPQTAFYNKSAMLYGLPQAKEAFKTEKLAVIVEGYMDVLASHQAGVTNVVASAGTALTREQVRIIKRFVPTVALAFDMDMAGEAASFRGLDLLWEEDLAVRVVLLPSGKDPDELIRKDPQAWRKALASAPSFMEYAVEQATKRNDLSIVEGKKSAAKQLLPLIARLADPIEQTHYLQKVSELLRVPEEILRSRLPRLAPKPVERKETIPEPKAKSRGERVAEVLLALSSQHPELLEYLIDQLEPEYLDQTTLLGLYKAIITYYTEKHQLDQRDFLQRLEREDHNLAHRAQMLFLLGTSDLLPQDEKARKQEILEGVAALKRLSLQRELSSLEFAIARAEKGGAEEDLQKLTRRVAELTQQLAEE